MPAETLAELSLDAWFGHDGDARMKPEQNPLHQ
jgi:hypothetical protein